MYAAVVLLLAISTFSVDFVESDEKCASNWYEYKKWCFKFSRSPRKSLQSARDACKTYNADLVSINSQDEHYFITSWLKENDPQHLVWFTSGRDHGTNLWKWDADGSSFSNIINLWLVDDQSRLRTNQWKNSAYNFSVSENRWGLVKVNPDEQSPYICEIRKEDLHHVIVTERNIDYGVVVTDRDKVPRGPKITSEPKPAVFYLSSRSQLNYVSLRCVADGYPTPTYQWFKEEYSANDLKFRLIDPLIDTRLTQTDGTLTIYSPQQNTDRGKYFCRASNEFGTVRSETVQLTFGYIAEFNKKRSPDYGKENWGKSLSCDPPQHHSKVNYYWTRNSFPNFVEEDRRVFVSHDGNLFFSALEKIDLANYSCNVQSVISSTGRTGPYFPLIVDPASSGQKLLFPTNFPKAFPEAPLAGEDVRLECIAYGYPVPTYNWTRVRDTKYLPDGSYTTSHNRVLIIPKAKVEDMGEYVCAVSSGTDTMSKSVTLSIQSLPVFTVPLTDQVKGTGTYLEWTCEAFGIPEVSYSWYKNGAEINVYDFPPEDINRYKIKYNILTIDGLVSDRDDGMYQCKAYNQLGSRWSSGQLKVLSMKPSFKKHPLDVQLYASTGGNITIPCIPEAIPFPQFTWKRNGYAIGGPAGRIRILPNGFLQINPVEGTSDAGDYTCIARNDLGVDQSSGLLTIFPRPRIIESPKAKIVADINDTIQLPCAAHSDSALDIAYIWRHNGLRLDLNSMPQYSMGSEIGHLRINNVTFTEAGEYVCVIKTSVGRSWVKTDLTVDGPPSRPGAVLAEDLTSTSAKLHWSDGSDNGRRILSYTIDGRTNHNNTWVVLAQDITSFISQPSRRREVIITNALSPWSTYEFRVFATNKLGTSPPSDPSPQYITDKDVPKRTCSNIGGGGGKAGTLHITWDPLPPQDWNSPEIWYKVYYRPAHSHSENRTKDLRSTQSVGMYTATVGEENYFTLFKVRVQAINSVGPGPISGEVDVFSAESMPQVQPSQVSGIPHNSTALKVSWAPLELTREKIRGRLIGYRIKYWKEGKDSTTDALTLLKRGIEPWGLIVALNPDTQYYVSVMAYNDAGSGPESEPFLARTLKAAPQRPPTSVHVKALDATSVMVTWRGVTTLTATDEEPIKGYKVRYWDKDKPISSAQEVKKNLDGGDLETVISGLIPGMAYKLRVMAYSDGGDGKMSSPPWEFKVGFGKPSPHKSRSQTLSGNYFTCLLGLLFVTILTGHVMQQLNQ